MAPPAEETEQTRLRALAAFRPIFEAPNFSFGEWTPSERRHDGVIVLGYYSLSPDGQRFLEAAYEHSWVQAGFRWMEWMGTPDARALLTDRQRLARATATELFRLLTALIRGDRFSDGTLAHAWKSGLLVAITRRAEELTNST